VAGGQSVPTERQVQRAILQMAGRCFPAVFITAIPNGAHLAGNQTARFKQMGAMKGDGLKIGFYDLLCLWHPGKGCSIEVKRPKLGVVSDAQVQMGLTYERLEWPATIVKSAEDAHAFLKACGAPCVGELS
jgi:hypothetical protein